MVIVSISSPGVPKLKLSSVVSNYAKCLKELYSKRKMPDYLKGRQLRTAKFVSLALVSREGVSKKEMDAFTRGTISGILVSHFRPSTPKSHPRSQRN